MPDGIFEMVVRCVPVAGSLVQGWDLVRVVGKEARAENVGEQVVVAVPGAVRVERNEEEVAALEVLEHAGAVGTAGDGVAERTGEPVEHSGAEQEVADLARLSGKDLVGQVVDD